MADKKTTKTNNPYAGKSYDDLVKEYKKLEQEYHESLAKGRVGSQDSANLRRSRAQMLTALSLAKNNQ